MPKLGADWFRGVDEKDKLDREIAVKNAKAILDIILRLAQSRRNSLERVAMTDYDSPAWAYREAHKNGRKEELDYFCKLLNLDHEEN